jgi:response regulator RpfG family c-di-GMP phosphodiesterase
VNDRILCVDDDANVLQAYQRALRKQFRIEPALGGEEALEAVRSQGPYAVVVADMRMPGMTGAELLAQVRRLAPDTVRMMLTGHADMETALQAVNEGQIFRFLTKPCPPELFARSLEAALEQHRLVTAERELLSKTLSGSVKVLADVLSLVSPAAFGRASRVRRLARRLCERLDVGETWQIEIAAMLSQIGCVAVPEETLAKVYRGERLSRVEAEALDNYPRVGAGLIAHIPRLEEVARIITYQEERFDAAGAAGDGTRGEELPQGARILKVALDYDLLVSAGISADIAVAEMHDREGCYDPAVLAALRGAMEIDEVYIVRRLRVSELIDGLVLAEDVCSINGTLLCAHGQEVTPSMRARLRTYMANVGISGPIKVFVPAELAKEMPAVSSTP